MSRRVTREWVLRRRLAVQRLSAAPLPHAAEVVRLLTCVQSQDAPLAAHSLALRSRDTSYADVLAGQAAGGWVRTHILRPTWHHVAPQDLRWVQSLTGPKVERGLGARHRQLGITPEVIEHGTALLRELLADGEALTRKQIGPRFAERGLPGPGEAMAHQLMVAEVRSVICSGPPRGAEHTYALVDEVVAPEASDDWSRDRAALELTHRFFAGHGPASERDLHRWSGLTLTEIRAASAGLTTSPSLRSSHPLESVECDGETLWFDPSVAARTTHARTAHLLSTFDEVALTYPSTGFPRRGPEEDRTRLVSESGGGVVVVGVHDVGTFKRTVGPGAVAVVVRSDVALSTDERNGVAQAAGRLAAFHERELRLTFV